MLTYIGGLLTTKVQDHRCELLPMEATVGIERGTFDHLP